MLELQETSLGQEYPLEEEMATHSSILTWEIPWTEKPGGLQPTGLQRVGHDWATEHSMKGKQHTVYQATTLLAGLLSFNVQSLWVLYWTVSHVFLFKFKILTIHAIYKSSCSGEPMARTYFKLIIPYNVFLPPWYKYSDMICFFDIRNALDFLLHA